MKKRILSVAVIVCMAVGLTSFAAIYSDWEAVSDPKYADSQSVNLSTETLSYNTDLEEETEQSKYVKILEETTESQEKEAAFEPQDNNTSLQSGDWRYRINDDNETVTICRYTGEETEVMIPDTIRDLPVTGIGVVAFDGGSMESIYLPKSVINFDYRAFRYISSLTAFFVAPDNPVYESEDGILYNKGKTEIIRYPTGKTEKTFSLPESVERIGDRNMSVIVVFY